jgi:hypothetical protein
LTTDVAVANASPIPVAILIPLHYPERLSQA